MTDDSDLLRRYAAHADQAAFRELVDRHLGKVYAVALRGAYGNTHLAQDAAQAVFTDLARKAHSLAGHKTLTGWLFLSARYATSSLVRNERRRREFALKAFESLLPDDPSEPEWQEVRPAIDDALHELNERDREALLLRFFEDCTFGEIGRHLTMTEDGARQRVERGIQKLRAILQRRGITSSAAAIAGALATQASVAVPASLAAAIVANATVSAVSTLSLFHLATMSTTTKAVGCALVLASIVGGIKIRNAFAGVEADRDQAISELVKARRQNADLLDKLAAADPHFRSGKTFGASSGKANDNGGRAFAVLRWSTMEREHPDFVPVIARKTRHDVASAYNRTLATLHLTPSVIAQVKALFVARAEAMANASATAVDNGATPNSDALQQATNEAKTPFDTQIKALVGDQDFDTLEKGAIATYDWPNRLRQADSYAVDMEDAGVPLTPDQNALLEQTVYSTFEPNINPKGNVTGYRNGSPTTGLSEMDADLITALGSNLTDSQIAVLRQSLKDENYTNYIYSLYHSKNVSAITVTY